MKFPIPLPFTINITQKDINEGCKENAEFCPVSRAVKRRLPKRFICRVRYQHILILNKNEHGETLRTHEIKNPPRLSKWIKSYDKNQEVRPARFRITKDHITRTP